ncbi:uncharacterized protein F5891DRAFT_984404 [Suillus fuscotomentosus]|uniref:Uncharacterized protein n=1 Tax=Suillus fuscotomentosus TaxID=1912939 RepID=A0AAD4HG26_9AGAM|nr:uncharacterized protein F5891DRAFT_984404 [Suillus fuscotomentosus]KAG1895197.1 hypothetical protein F5891DRAFT_984404 [Suillus fuscotomentosus]
MPMVTAPMGSFVFSLPYSTGHSTSLSEFTTMVAIDANSYHYQNDTLRSIEARMGTLTSEVSDVTVKNLAHGASLNATYKLAQDSMDSNSCTRILLQDVRGDIAVLKLESEVMRVVLMEI